MVTSRSASVATWSYPNIHGDVTYTIDQGGVKAGPFLYDPYGQPLTGVANTGPGDMDNGWLGQHQRPSEHQPGFRPTIEMGARPYRPDLGRFLRIDPIDGGATFSNYSYPDDPINQLDLTGKYCWTGVASREAIGTMIVWSSVSRKSFDQARARHSPIKVLQGRGGAVYQTGRLITKYKEHCRTPSRSIGQFLLDRTYPNEAEKTVMTSIANAAQACWTTVSSPAGAAVTGVGAAAGSGGGPVGAAAGAASAVASNCAYGVIDYYVKRW